MQIDEILAKKEPREFINELVDYVVNPDHGGMRLSDLKHAPSLVEAAIFIRAFDATIDTSGIYKWLIEFELERDPDLVKIFDLIGAKNAGDYVRAALEIFPGHTIPDDLDERFEICDQHEGELLKLDRKFADAPIEAISKLREYLVANRSEFESQVKQFWKRLQRDR